MRRTKEDYFPIKLSFSPLLIPSLTEEEETEFCDNCLLKHRPDIILLVPSHFRTIQDITDVIRNYYEIPVIIELNVGGFNLSGTLPVGLLKKISEPITVAPLRSVRMRPRCHGQGHCGEDLALGSLLSLQEFAEMSLSSRSTRAALDVEDSGFLADDDDEGAESLMNNDDDDGDGETGDDTEDTANVNGSEDADNSEADSVNRTPDKQDAVAKASNGGGSSMKEHNYAEVPGSWRSNQLMSELRPGNLFVVTPQGLTIPVKFGVLSVVSSNGNPVVRASNGRKIKNGEAQGKASHLNEARAKKDRHSDPGAGAVSRKRNFETAFSTVADYLDLARPFKRVFEAITETFGDYSGTAEETKDSSQALVLSSPMSMVNTYDPEDYAAQRQWKPLTDQGLEDIGVNSILKFKMTNSSEADEDEDIVLIVEEVQENSITGAVITGSPGEQLPLTVYKSAMKDVRVWLQNNGNHEDSQM